ncbi:MAG: outer membrane lipoprotein chaperone LolA [Terriglobales bacterium]
MRVPRIFLCILLLAASAWGQADVHKIADRADNFYNHIQSMQVHFTETYRGVGMQRSESGTLELKKPGKMRWDYDEPQKKLFLSDGHTAWFYVPGEQQVRKAPVKKLDDLRSPLQYLLGKTKLEKEFENLSLAPDVTPSQSGDVVLRGIPKSMADRVSQVLLEITPEGHFRRIVIEELDGSTTEFLFSGEKTNVALADSQFKFVPPPGVETVEATGIAE